MKSALKTILLSLALVFLLSSCGGGKKMVEITNLETYTDPYYSFSIQYPSNWYTQKYPNDRLISFSSQVGMKRFKTFDPDGEASAKIEIDAQPISSLVTLDTIMAKKQFTAETYSKPTEVMIDGAKAYKLTYKFELNDGAFQGEVYYARKDPGVVTVITFETFAGLMDKYREKFDEVLKSVKLASMPKERKTDTVKKLVEAPPPSQKLVIVTGDGFTMMVPDNFDVKNPKAGGILKSWQFIGERRADCDIRVDMIDASKQNKLDKIVDDNKGKHKNSTPKPTTVSGQKAFVFEYSPVASVMSKVWYVINGQKLYRITINWFQGEEKDYKPIFEKSVNTFKF